MKLNISIFKRTAPFLVLLMLFSSISSKSGFKTKFNRRAPTAEELRLEKEFDKSIWGDEYVDPKVEQERLSHIKPTYTPLKGHINHEFDKFIADAEKFDFWDSSSEKKKAEPDFSEFNQFINDPATSKKPKSAGMSEFDEFVNSAGKKPKSEKEKSFAELFGADAYANKPHTAPPAANHADKNKSFAEMFNEPFKNKKGRKNK